MKYVGEVVKFETLIPCILFCRQSYNFESQFLINIDGEKGQEMKMCNSGANLVTGHRRRPVSTSIILIASVQMRMGRQHTAGSLKSIINTGCYW